MNSTQMLILAAIACLVAFCIVRAIRRRPESSRSDHEREGARTGLASHPAEESLATLKRELDDSFRTMNERLDAKMHVLDELLLDADRKIKELREWHDTPPSPDQEGGEADREPVVVEMDRSVLLGPMARAAKIASAPRQELWSPRETPDEAFDRSPELASEATNRWERIYRLADEGRSPSQISQETGQAAGEIELILGLRRRRHPGG